MSEEIMRAIGQLEGKIDGVQTTLADHGAKLDGIDGRLRTVERTGIASGSAAGTAAGAMVAVGIEFIKRGLGVGA